MKKTTKKNTKKKKDYEYKKSVITITCVLTIILGILIGSFVYKYTKGESILHNSSEVSIKNYLTVTNTVRKFSNKEYTIILSPYGYDLKNNKDYYLLIDNTNPDKVVYSYGSYVQETSYIDLSNGEKLYINEDGLRYKNSLLSIDKENVEYYTYKDETSKYLLIKNTKKNNNYILYISTKKNSITIMNDSYTESDSYITLSDGTLFTKSSDSDHIVYNSIQMNLGK